MEWIGSIGRRKRNASSDGGWKFFNSLYVFMESVAKSAAIDSQMGAEQKRKQQSLLIKTFPIYMKVQTSFERLDSTFKILSDLKNSNSPMSEKVNSLMVQAQANPEVFVSHFEKLGPVFNTTMAQVVASQIEANPEKAISLLQEALNVFGQFNAADDANIFFRPGLLDFKYFSILLGQMADFYAGQIISKTILNKQKLFLSQCSDETAGQVTVISEKCQLLFGDAVQTYLTERQGQGIHPQSQVFASIGEAIPSFPVTSLIMNDANEVNDSLANYRQVQNAFNTFSPADFANFSVSSKDMAYGYWGSDMSEKLKAQYPSDVKSQKYMSLGSAKWFDVLATSPAEPGLANIQPITQNTTAEKVIAETKKGVLQRWTGLDYRSDMVSVGGWPDLHPTLVLKASGSCDEVVYLTRKGGTSVFGQQVYIRLSNLQEKASFWKELTGTANDLWLHDTADQDLKQGEWGAIYDLSNSESSFNKSIAEADKVYCTDWDSFNLFTENGLQDLIIDAYTSPIVVPGEVRSVDYPGCTPY
ncbi:MAG: hypothetical protein HRT44_03055 [Bdellovibrionales bacterium]|nr:hypothetical protein [Bdellovibrionales bacterium]NQZ18225.1 hypothetical protein [Bdellovibrionales bacterium]